MNKILVTGGAGFIGSHLVDKLIEGKYRVFVIDNLSTGRHQNINPKSEFVNLDITGKKTRETIVKIKPDYIFHLAAQTSIAKSQADPKEDFRTNLTALVPILEAAAKLKVKKFIFASSAAVYGDSKKLPIAENFPKNPTSPYGISKLSAEFLILLYEKSYGLPNIILRYANVYGPRQDSSAEGGVVSIFTNNILGDKAVTIFGSGNQTRDFIYVTDIVEANLRVLEKGVTGIFNVSTGKEISVNTLHRKIATILKKEIKKLNKPARNLEIQNSALSWDKIKGETSWSPKVNIAQGLLQTVNYFKSHGR